MEVADFGLVALDERCVGLMSPSKIHSYLGYGKPLIYVGPSGSMSRKRSKYRCGFQCSQGDLEALSNCLAQIADKRFNYAHYQAQALPARPAPATPKRWECASAANHACYLNIRVHCESPTHSVVRRNSCRDLRTFGVGGVEFPQFEGFSGIPTCGLLREGS